MIVLGFLSAFFFLLLVIKYPLRKLGFNKANAFMMKLHEAASLGVFVTGIVQIVVGLKRYTKDKLLSVVTGMLVYLIDFAIIAACHMTKDVKRKMHDHRLLSLASCAALAGHVTVNIIARKSSK